MRAWMGAALAAGAAIVPAAFLWGFSVDDAWIVARVADNGALLGHYFFNNETPATDAVTPLGFAQVIGVLAQASGRSAFALARGLGAFSWALALGLVIARALRERVRAVAWLVLFASLVSVVSGHAWAGAGLETPIVALVLLLGLWSAEGPEASLGLGALGWACAWRPELGFVVVAAAWGLSPDLSHSTRLQRVAAVLVLPAGVAGVRWFVFGSPLPLSFAAKTPELGHGLLYATGGLVFSGALALGLLATSGRPGGRTALGLVVIHAAALVFAGGDWMPFYRLYVPLLPWLVWSATRAAHMDVAPHLAGAAKWARRGLAALRTAALVWLVASATLLVVNIGQSGRAVVQRRESWIRQGRPLLGGASRVAALDIGWVGQATAAPIVDLAGVTDPLIAALPGGHTSKQLSAGLFAQRNVDAWVVRVQGPVPRAPESVAELACVYEVDHRLRQGASDMGFRITGTIAIEGAGDHYVITRLGGSP